MDIIWAKGQEPGNYIHSPDSGIERGNGDPDFYREDEVKYHGKSMQRGKGSLNFFGKLLLMLCSVVVAVVVVDVVVVAVVVIILEMGIYHYVV